MAGLVPSVCFTCRKSFKRPCAEGAPDCPDCGRELIQLSEKFRAPKLDDEKGWRVVEFVVSHGFRYHALRAPAPDRSGRWIHRPYPTTMREARDFVADHDPAQQWHTPL